MICRTTRPRSELMRFARTGPGSVRLDPSGGLPGRGAHVCLRRTCVEEVFRKDRLARGLKTDLSTEELDTLRERAVEYLLSKGEWS